MVRYSRRENAGTAQRRIDLVENNGVMMIAMV